MIKFLLFVDSTTYVHNLGRTLSKLGDKWTDPGYSSQEKIIPEFSTGDCLSYNEWDEAFGRWRVARKMFNESIESALVAIRRYMVYKLVCC